MAHEAVEAVCDEPEPSALINADAPGMAEIELRRRKQRDAAEHDERS
jgi:hypothetical protein